MHMTPRLFSAPRPQRRVVGPCGRVPSTHHTEQGRFGTHILQRVLTAFQSVRQPDCKLLPRRADPASEPPPSGWPPSGPHSSLPPPARLHAYPHLVDELIDPTSSADHTTAHHSHCMYSALNASAVTRDSNISTTTLSMNSMAGRSGQTDCEAFPQPELTHIQSLWPDECASIELPPPPQRMPQHAQHTQREEGAPAQEWRTEMAEVVSMLRMVTERVTELQRSRQVNV